MSAPLLFTACSSDIDEAQADKTHVALQVSARMEGMTRANDGVWEADAIGVSADASSALSASQNVKFTTTSTTASADFTTSSPIYFPDDNTYTFTAYGPYQSAVGTVSFNTSDQSTRSKQKAFDYIFATGTASKANPNFNGVFCHKLTKLVLRITPGTDATATGIAANTYSVSGLIHEGTFNTTTGEATATGTATADWSLDNNSLKTTSGTDILFTTLLAPGQSTKGCTFTATIDGTPKTVSLPELTLAAGKSYIVTLKVDGSSVAATGCTVTDWTNGGTNLALLERPNPLAVITAGDVGKVITSDGRLFATVADANASGSTPVAMIAYVGTDTGNDTYKHGLAVALSDAGNTSYTDKDTPFSLVSSYESKAKAPYGSSGWFHGTKYQWKHVLLEHYDYSELNKLLEKCGGTMMNGSYWTASASTTVTYYYISQTWKFSEFDFTYYKSRFNVRYLLEF